MSGECEEVLKESMMSIESFNIGDIAECPECSKEFEFHSEDDFDDYFEHVSTCQYQGDREEDEEGEENDE